MRFYSDLSRENDKWALPDCETFYVKAGEAPNDELAVAAPGGGWFYWFCFPGCLPDSEPFGPYDTEQNAIDACRETHG